MIITNGFCLGYHIRIEMINLLTILEESIIFDEFDVWIHPSKTPGLSIKGLGADIQIRLLQTSHAFLMLKEIILFINKLPFFWSRYSRFEEIFSIFLLADAPFAISDSFYIQNKEGDSCRLHLQNNSQKSR